MCVFVCFFFKRKTAYWSRISDWSSDVCSSDLLAGGAWIGEGTDRRCGGFLRQMGEQLAGAVTDMEVHGVATELLLLQQPAVRVLAGDAFRVRLPRYQHQRGDDRRAAPQSPHFRLVFSRLPSEDSRRVCQEIAALSATADRD